MNTQQPAQPTLYSKFVSQPIVQQNIPTKNTLPTYVIFTILFLAFIGFNIFGYLAMGSNYLADIVVPTLVYIHALVTYFFAEFLKLMGYGLIGGSNLLEKTTTQDTSNLKDVLNKPSVKPPLQAGSDDSSSKVQSTTKSVSKAGWCFTGDDPFNNVRSCIQVGDFDKCMSGSVFSTLAKCVDPKSVINQAV
jgi:hypothetical protein